MTEDRTSTGNPKIDRLIETSETYRAVAENLAAYEAQKEAVRSDAELSAEDRRDRLVELHQEHTKRHEDLHLQFKVERAKEHGELQKSLFGPPTGLREGAEARASGYRDALLRLKDARPEDLSEAAEIAKLTGDEVLARAVAATAHRRGDVGTVERALAGEKSRERYERYHEISNENVAAMVGPWRPPRLSERDFERSADGQRAAQERDEKKRSALRTALFGGR